MARQMYTISCSFARKHEVVMTLMPEEFGNPVAGQGLSSPLRLC